MISVYAVGRPSKVGQRLKDGSVQIDLGNLRRDTIFWARVEQLVSAWCDKQFSSVSDLRTKVENPSQLCGTSIVPSWQKCL